jgi:hypothetical protein
VGVILSEQTRTKILHTHDQRFGGYPTYWKIYFKLWGKIFDIPWETPWKMARVHSIVGTILKTPWWLLIKPLGCLFKQRTVRDGEHLKLDGKLTSWDIRKTITWFLVGIPVMWYRSKMTEKELAEL